MDLTIDQTLNLDDEKPLDHSPESSRWDSRKSQDMQTPSMHDENMVMGESNEQAEMEANDVNLSF